jgi:hypothetical protein
MILNKIKTYDELVDYIKRSLGEPIIKVNVTGEQIKDRIKDAFDLFREYHFNATEKVLLSHKLSQNDIKHREIKLPDAVSGVQEVYTGTRGQTAGWHGYNYISLFQEMRGQSKSGGGGITSFISFERNIAELSSLLNEKIRWNFVKHKHVLKMDANWDSFLPGDFILIEGWMLLDPEEFTDLLNDPWIKEYSMWLTKYQWGVNLTKFQNVTLPGGISISGDQMLQDAKENIDRMRTEIVDKWQMPGMITLG